MRKYDDLFLDDVRNSVPISELIGRRVTWDRRKSNPGRRDFWACCPFHGEKSPSFHCEDGKGRYHCFSCGASGDHFRFLTELDGISFPAAVAEVAALGGVTIPDARGLTPAEEAERDRRRAFWEEKKRRDAHAAAEKEAARIQSAGADWRGTKAMPGTFGEAYLTARGLPAWSDPNLRFHPALFHEIARVTRPAVVGRVQGPDGSGKAIWRIFIKPDGSDKAFGKGDRHDAKIGKGPARGGAVRLGGDAETIGIGEGIETCRAAFLLDGRWPIWAGLSTSGIISFEPPPFVKRVVIYPDGDKPRRRDGIDYGPPGMLAARELQARLHARELLCDIADPPLNGDYLDVWNSRR